MKILEGKVLSDQIKNEVAQKVTLFQQKNQRTPHLVVLLVGDNPASQVYVRTKAKACEKIGMKSTIEVLSSAITQNELEGRIRAHNLDGQVDGILVQLPLPAHLNADQALQLLDPNKDVDALTLLSEGKVFAGKATVYPCTPYGITKLLDFHGISVEGKHAVIIGRSMIVGKPMAMLLLEKNMTVTICHSKSQDLKKITQSADVVVVAAGKPLFFGKDYFAKDAVVIDVGIHGSGTGGKICGDVRFDELDGWVSAATPVPGGVGPLTIACLLENTLKLAELRCR